MPILHFHGHATATVTTEDGTRIIVDPFLDDNPVADVGTEAIEALDYILCTHGHYDHFADAIPLARKTGATVIATYEIVEFIRSTGLEAVHPLNIGGGNTFPFGYAKMTPALHGGSVAGDDTGRYTTLPGGFLIDFGDASLYHAGDTALLTDMQLLRGKVDVALLPIGDNFTMGPEDAAVAVDFIRPSVVVPIHYGTWGYIDRDPNEFAELVGDLAEVRIMGPGDELRF